MWQRVEVASGMSGTPEVLAHLRAILRLLSGDPVVDIGLLIAFLGPQPNSWVASYIRSTWLDVYFRVG